jgi:signal transduction histidine kinase
VINRLKALFVRALAWARMPRERDDIDRHPDSRPSMVALDDVVILAEDLRNLLRVAIECAGAMHTHAVRGLPVDDDFRDLGAACDRSGRIVDRLMRIDQAPDAPQPINVNLAVFECSEMLERALGDRIHLHVRLAPHLEPVLAAPAEVERILLNLAVNGRHAMPDRGALTVETASLKEVPAGLRPPHVRARSYVRLTVSDTGPGIPSGTRLLVLGRTPLRDQRGAGVALAAVAHTVRSLDGALRIEGDDGHGTRVLIDLPCVETADANRAAG